MKFYNIAILPFVRFKLEGKISFNVWSLLRLEDSCYVFLVRSQNVLLILAWSKNEVIFFISAELAS